LKKILIMSMLLIAALTYSQQPRASWTKPQYGIDSTGDSVRTFITTVQNPRMPFNIISINPIDTSTLAPDSLVVDLLINNTTMNRIDTAFNVMLRPVANLGNNTDTDILTCVKRSTVKYSGRRQYYILVPNVFGLRVRLININYTKKKVEIIYEGFIY